MQRSLAPAEDHHGPALLVEVELATPFLHQRLALLRNPKDLLADRVPRHRYASADPAGKLSDGRIEGNTHAGGDQ